MFWHTAMGNGGQATLERPEGSGFTTEDAELTEGRGEDRSVGANRRESAGSGVTTEDAERRRGNGSVGANRRETARFSAVQERLALALAGGRRVKDAARECEVGERTAHTWLGLPGFRAHVDELRGRVREEAIQRMAETDNEARETLRALLKDESSSIRLRAAMFLLTHTEKVRQREENERRAERLEEAEPAASTEPVGEMLRQGLARTERKEGETVSPEELRVLRSFVEALENPETQRLLEEHQRVCHESGREAGAEVMERVWARLKEVGPLEVIGLRPRGGREDTGGQAAHGTRRGNRAG